MNEQYAFLTIHGSHAYNLNGPNSDMDHRGFFFADPEHFWGLTAGPEQKEGLTSEDSVFWEFRKFVKLCSSSNPNVIECLFTDSRDVLVNCLASSTMRTNAREWFLSKKCQVTFGGFAHQQFQKIVRNEDWSSETMRKHAMHCARVIMFGLQIAETGNLVVKFDPHTNPGDVNFLRSIRSGLVQQEYAVNWIAQNIEKMKTAFDKSNLQAEPRHEEINEFVIQTMEIQYW